MPCSPQDISWLLGIPNHSIVYAETLVEGCVMIVLERKARRLKCPRCKALCSQYDTVQRVIQDMPVWGNHSLLVVPVPRVDCPDCGIRTLQHSWLGPSGRRTRRYERWIYELTKWIPVSDVAELTELSWSTVKNIEKSYIHSELRKRNLDGIKVLGIDEIAYRKGQRYLTIITDVLARRVIAVEKGREGAALKRFFRRFGKKRLAKVQSVIIDMHDPYEKAIREMIPETTVVYDRFHLIKMLNEVVDKIRRRIQREMTPKDRTVLKNKRFVLLKARENLTERQKVALAELREANEPISDAYLLKEDFREIYQARTVRDARQRIAAWIRRAKESGLPEMIKFIKTLRRRFKGILAYFKHGFRLTNGLAEGFNNVIKTIKKVSYGLRDMVYFKLKILRHCGKLPQARPTGF